MRNDSYILNLCNYTKTQYYVDRVQQANYNKKISQVYLTCEWHQYHSQVSDIIIRHNISSQVLVF